MSLEHECRIVRATEVQYAPAPIARICTAAVLWGSGRASLSEEATSPRFTPDRVPRGAVYDVLGRSTVDDQAALVPFV